MQTRGAANLKQNLSYPQISKFMKLIYGTTIFPRGKHSFERRMGRGRNSISFMVICLAVLLRVHAMTSYFCCLGTWGIRYLFKSLLWVVKVAIYAPTSSKNRKK